MVFTIRFSFIILKLLLGMTDLLAPILSVVDDDVEAFWCFVNLMEFSCICKTEKKLITIKRQMVRMFTC